MAFVACGLLGVCVSASDREAEQRYETLRHERHRDFEKFVKSRERSPEAEAAAADALKAARKADVEKQAEAQREFVQKMKRYSMEEVEAKDRADEERLAKEKLDETKVREAFVATRNRYREIDARIGDVDTYKEFEIDMKHEPESRVTHSSSSKSED